MGGEFGNDYSAVQSAVLSNQQQRQAALENSLKMVMEGLASLKQGVQFGQEMGFKKSEAASKGADFNRQMDYYDRSLTQQKEIEAARIKAAQEAKTAASQTRELNIPFGYFMKQIQGGGVDEKGALEAFRGKVTPEEFSVAEKAIQENRGNVERHINFGADILNKHEEALNARDANLAIAKDPILSKSKWHDPAQIAEANKSLTEKINMTGPQAKKLLSDESVMPFLQRDPTGKTMKFVPKLPWQAATAGIPAPDRSLNVPTTPTGDMGDPTAMTATNGVARIKSGDKIWRIPADKIQDAMTLDPNAVLLHAQ